MYGGGGCGPIVALWRRSNFLMVDGSELKKWLWWNTVFLTTKTWFEIWKPIYHMKAYKKTRNLVFRASLSV